MSALVLLSDEIGAFRDDIWSFYRAHGRDFAWRGISDPYAVLVSEMMLQQTQTVRVIAKYDEWMHAFPTVQSLAAAALSDVLDPKTTQKILDLPRQFVEKNRLTAFMVTHNMCHAIQYGNRLIMMLEGRVVFDVRGEDKRRLQVQNLMQKFQSAKGDSLSDRMLLN